MHTADDLKHLFASLTDRECLHLARWLDAVQGSSGERGRVAEDRIAFDVDSSSPRVGQLQLAIAALDSKQQRELHDWLRLSRWDEPSDVLQAIDAGLNDLLQGRSRTTSRAELTAKVRKWSGASS